MTAVAPGTRALIGVGALLGILLVAVGKVAAQQEGSAPPVLVDRLVEIERRLPALPPDMPEEVVLSEDRTWADFSGDFVGAMVALEGLVEEARALFVEADETDGEAAEAVAGAARAVLEFHRAYQHLAEWESHDLDLPLGEPSGVDAATFADELYGEAGIGLRLLSLAHARRLSSYAVLRDDAAASDEAKEHFDVQYQAERAFAARVLPELRRALSEETTRVMVAVERFRSTGTGEEARARTLTVACVDREAYMSDRAANSALVAELRREPQADVAPEAVALVGLPAADCPDLPPEAALRPAP